MDPQFKQLQDRVATLESKGGSLQFHTHTGSDMNKVRFTDLDGVQAFALISKVTLMSSQVLALKTTPVTLIKAPGAGACIIVEGITAKVSFNTIAYTGANALEFRYTNGAGTKVTADMASAFLDSASTAYDYAPAVTAEFTPVTNAAVVVAVPTADPAAGNSPITFVVKYRVTSF